ncbi:hypothetical protein G6F55_000013 [Rhizopus delemar]|nr:hypothetical protein G6F55_000013 [Rhizopus delemar]
MNNNNNKEYNNNNTVSLSPTEQQTELLWNNVNTLAIPGSEEETATASPSPSLSKLIYDQEKQLNEGIAVNATQYSNIPAHDSSAFNISWGGNDKPPAELHPEEKQEPEIKLSRPLPKPRGIRKLPEPEPSEDGTIDEDVLKRRKNTDAARRSRLKKLLKVDQLETKVAALQAENAKLILNNAVLESEKKSLYAKEVEYKKRINYLEEVMKRHGWQELLSRLALAKAIKTPDGNEQEAEPWSKSVIFHQPHINQNMRNTIVNPQSNGQARVKGNKYQNYRPQQHQQQQQQQQQAPPMIRARSNEKPISSSSSSASSFHNKSSLGYLGGLQ